MVKSRWIPGAVRVLAILVIGAGIGILYNAFTPGGTPLPRSDRPSSTTGFYGRGWNNATLINLPKAKAAYDGRETLFVDARPEDAYVAGHIPGARNVPIERFAECAAGWLLDLPKTTVIVTYCSGSSCGSSVKLADMLRRIGLTRTRAFYGGWRAWTEAGYPVARGLVP